MDGGLQLPSTIPCIELQIPGRFIAGNLRTEFPFGCCALVIYIQDIKMDLLLVKDNHYQLTPSNMSMGHFFDLLPSFPIHLLLLKQV